jgi:hypothetical protein
MTPKDLAIANAPDLVASFAALKRAAALARKIAIQTDTGIVILKDGEIMHISAE